MKAYLLAAAAAIAIASPAEARDGAPYFGVEGGVLFANDSDVDVDLDVDGDPVIAADDAFAVDYKTGYDVDLLAGYDFGMIRAEAELGYKRAKGDQFEVDADVLDALEDELGEPVTADDLDIDGKVRVLSLMGNILLDFGNEDGWSAYVGPGFGRAGVKAFGENDSAWAWQIIAGVRTAISPNMDIGVKYRYFRTGKLHYDDRFNFDGSVIDTDVGTRFTSHSLLASLIFNFGTAVAPPPAPLPPPPPPPPPPATQTCADGSVILATDMCPPPAPPPPPPPPPSGERG